MKGLLSAAPSAVPVATSTPCVVVGAQSFGFDKAAGDSPFELTWETAQHAVSHRPPNRVRPQSSEPHDAVVCRIHQAMLRTATPDDWSAGIDCSGE